MSLLRLLCSSLLLISLVGCHSLSPIDVDRSISPATGAETSYLVGVVGVWPDARYTLHEQTIMLRQRGGDGQASARLRNNVHLRTPRDIRDGQRGIGSLFVMPLKPGRYELYNVLFRRGTATTWRREEFSIPLQLEAGKAYYIGDFRAACVDLRGKCAFIHRYDLQRDQPLANSKHPGLPPLQQLELQHLDGAYPTLLEDDGEDISLFKSALSGGSK